jgi:hypothetical protein
MQSKDTSIIISSPIYIKLGKTSKAKNHSLNLNQYRNWHFRTSSAIKNAYQEIIAGKVAGLSFKGKIGLEFKLFKRDKRHIDRANFCCIVEKFFCDTLVKEGVIEDDNDKFISYSLYTTGGVDKHDPRCEITIHDLSVKSEGQDYPSVKES